mgnify:CR=1 FL=1
MTTEEQNLEDTKQITTDDLIADLIDGAEVFTIANDKFLGEFNFYGKTLKEWGDYLQLPIPTKNEQGEFRQLSPVDIQKLFARLSNLLQVTNHFHSMASTMSTGLNAGGLIKKADLIASIIRSYEARNAKRPAATAIDKMADSYLSDGTSAKIAARIVKEFFRDRYDALIEVRKCLEAINMSLNMELKYLESDKVIP